MKLIIILTILISTTFATEGNIKCDKLHSQVYDEYKGNYDVLRQKNTYGGNFDDKCMELGEEYREKYINILKNHNINCQGKWCVHGTYSCKGVESECYQVEHIVDRKNTPYKDCGTNILGNVIMAYGLWNRQVGQLCWENVYAEKKEIYGEDIVCQAIRNIVSCGNCNVSLPEECKTYTIKKKDEIIIF
jgi:hypothetical protein